jgi:hypothetical protein
MSLIPEESRYYNISFDEQELEFTTFEVNRSKFNCHDILKESYFAMDKSR